MKKRYLYTAVILDIVRSNKICKGELDENHMITAYSRMAFESVYFDFVSGTSENKNFVGYILVSEIQDDKITNHHYVLGHYYTLPLAKCFNLKFDKVEGKQYAYDVTPEFSKFAEENLEPIVEKIYKSMESNSPRRGRKPFEAADCVINQLMDRIEKDSGNYIVDTTQYLYSIVFKLGNNDVVHVYRNIDDKIAYDFYSEELWFKNGEKIMKGIEGNDFRFS